MRPPSHSRRCCSALNAVHFLRSGSPAKARPAWRNPSGIPVS